MYTPREAAYCLSLTLSSLSLSLSLGEGQGPQGPLLLLQNLRALQLLVVRPLLLLVARPLNYSSLTHFFQAAHKTHAFFENLKGLYL